MLPTGGIQHNISKIWRYRKPVGGKLEMAVRPGLYINIALRLRYKNKGYIFWRKNDVKWGKNHKNLKDFTKKCGLESIYNLIDTLEILFQSM